MKKQEITSIALKLLGVFAFLSAISMLQFLSIFITQFASARQMPPEGWRILALSLLPFVLLICASTILVTRGESLASRLFPACATEETPQKAFSANEIQTIAFSVMGLYVFLTALPKLAEVGLTLFSGILANTPDVIRWTGRRSWILGASALIQAVLGLLLFLQARGVSNLWHRIRGRGE